MSELINLNGMTGREIINLVRRKTNVHLKLSPKSKKSIIKHAEKLLNALPNNKIEDNTESILYLPNSVALRNKVTSKDIENFIKEFSTEKIISRIIGSYLSTAFALVESKGQRVLDIMMDANEFCKIIRFSKSIFEASTKELELKRSLVGKLWGVRVWVRNEAKGIACYPKKMVETKYPFIAESKKILKIKD